MNGLKLSSGKSSAVNVQNKSVLYVHLPDGTENYISDSESQSDESYYPDGVLAGDEKRNGALYSKGSVVLSGGGLFQLDGKKKHGVSVKSHLTVRPGVTIVVNNAADNCFKADGITVLGGYIWAKTSADAGKCLSSDSDVTVQGGRMKLYTAGGSVYEEDEKDTSSPAGIKADGEIIIGGGVLNIQVTGKSDGSEGLESKSGITVNGGRIFAFSDNNDGIDSNGKLLINGGLVIASGSGTPEEGFDCDRSQNFIVTGGTLIGTGGAAISTSTSSKQRTVIYNGVNARKGELFVIVDADGNPILKYELPRTMSGMSLFFSSPELKSGVTYTVYSGGTLDGNTANWNGWFEDGLYTEGEILGSFESDNINTTVGQGNGHGGGGPGNGGPGNGGPGNGRWG